MTARISSVGPPVTVPTGAPGRGITAFTVDAAGALTAAMSDGTVEPVPLPTASGPGGIESGDPNAIPLSQDVKDYVTAVTDPIKAKDVDQDTRLGNITAAVQNITDTGATDAELATAIANLRMADYLKITDAANAYAPLAHRHAIGDVDGLSSALTGKVTDPASKTTGDVLTWTAGGWIAAAPASAPDLTPYLLKSDASATYATTAALDGKITDPATKATGNVLTYNGTAWVAQAPAAAPDLTPYLLKTDASATYQTKLPNGTATGQVWTWNGTGMAWAAPATVDTSTLVPKSAFTAKGVLLVGSGASTYSALTPPALGPGVLTADTAGNLTWGNPATERFGMAGTLTTKSGGGRCYNVTGTARTITTVHASVGTAPAGSGVTVQLVLDGGTNVATLTIAAGANTATATVSTQWPAGSYLQANVTAVGSTTAGSDLVVAVRAS